ncbi:DJ-1/PfpI family protein [Effusibacillus dendaii]|uniref:Protease n=1 Tax=Effusibacillus dendaii TaxID=2743772 RepID=A0A7I8DH69_9BACL|nr:DJ-1/PfpI family protein [Effusibacillus dendaii]BCJ87950.1 protease [Effusibacillus dendaii]
MSKRVLIVTGDAVEVLELMYPYYRCLEEGIDVTIASPNKKKLYTVVHDRTEGIETSTEKPGYAIDSHISFRDVNPADYDGLIIPGGRAPEYIRLDPNLPKIIAHFFEANKPIGAICHAAQVFTVVKPYLEGRKVSAVIGIKPDVEACGATYVNDRVHVDGQLVSAFAWPDLPGFMREFFRVLNR